MSVEEALQILGAVYLCIAVWLGYRRSHRFHKEFTEAKDKQAFIDDCGPVTNWELGAVTKLPRWLSVLGKGIAIIIILAMFLLIIIGAYGALTM